MVTDGIAKKGAADFVVAHQAVKAGTVGDDAQIILGGHAGAAGFEGGLVVFAVRFVILKQAGSEAGGFHANEGIFAGVEVGRAAIDVDADAGLPHGSGVPGKGVIDDVGKQQGLPLGALENGRGKDIFQVRFHLSPCRRQPNPVHLAPI